MAQIAGDLQTGAGNGDDWLACDGTYASILQYPDYRRRVGAQYGRLGITFERLPDKPGWQVCVRDTPDAPLGGASTALVTLAMLPGSSAGWVQGVAPDGGFAVGAMLIDGIAHPVTFQDGVLTELPNLEGGSGGTWTPTAYACSDDGSLVVGLAVDASAFAHAAAWRGGVLTDLGNVAGGAFGGAWEPAAWGCSTDGSIIVGAGRDAAGNAVATLWRDGVIEELGLLPGGISSVANGCSPDGSIIAGQATDVDNASHAVLWRDGAITDLGIPPGYTSSMGYACSADGRVVVGTGNDGVNDYPMIWRDGAVAPLGTLPGYGGLPYDCTPDGGIAVGVLFTPGWEQACPVYWRSGQVVQLQSLPGAAGGYLGEALSITADGQTIVGDGNDAAGIGTPLVWTFTALMTLPPVNSTVPYAYQTGDALTCTMGEWDGEPTSYAYQWQLDGANVATGPTYVVTADDVGRSATCIVTATNAEGSATAPPSNAVLIAAPVIGLAEAPADELTLRTPGAPEPPPKPKTKRR